MKYSTVIFDLDGTLTDTIDDLMDSVNFALRKYGYPERSKSEITSFVGNGVRRLVYLSVPEGTDEAMKEKALTVFKDYYKEHSMDKTRAYDGVTGMLSDLKHRGVKMAVVTNKIQDAAVDVVTHFFGDIFDIIVGQIDGIAQKPEPDGVLHAMVMLGASKEKTVYVGDSEVDCATAENSGLPIIGVDWGFRGRALLEKCNADYIVDAPAEIERIVCD